MSFVPAGTRGSLMCIWETRVKDFAAFVKGSGIVLERGAFGVHVVTNESQRRRLDWMFDKNLSWDRPGFDQTPNHPVSCVSVIDARSFCQWLTLQEQEAGLLPLDCCYALPSDEEWSAATHDTIYPWGDDWPPAEDAGNYFDAWTANSLPGGIRVWKWLQIPKINDGAAHTSPVGSFPPNYYGLFDLGGNLAEFADSRFMPSLNDEKFRQTHPSEEIERDSEDRPFAILRGGSWSTSSPDFIPCDVRDALNINRRADNIGFRVVLATMPETVPSLRARADIRAQRKDWPGAIADYSAALQIDPLALGPRINRAIAYMSAGQYSDALDDLNFAAERHSANVQTVKILTLLLAAAPDDRVRNSRRAVGLAKWLCESSDEHVAEFHDIAAAAYAEAGAWQQATSEQDRALSLLDPANTTDRAEYQARLERYRKKQPYRLSPVR